MRNQRKFAIIATITAVLIIAGLAIWWYAAPKNNQETSNQKIAWSREEVMADFKDSQIKTQGDAIPPQNIKDRYNQAINKSKAAIEANQPSDLENKDLLWDYLTVATSYGILGDYTTAEEWYLKTLEKFPDDYRANMNLGDLYVLMGRLKDAAGKFYDTVEFYPKDAMIYTKFAELYYKYAANNKERADMIFDLGVQNSEHPKQVLNAYITYLGNFKHDTVKLEEIQREYDKVSGNKAEQQAEELQQNLDLK